jgi:hypothetical protein
MWSVMYQSTESVLIAILNSNSAASKVLGCQSDTDHHEQSMVSSYFVAMNSFRNGRS